MASHLDCLGFPLRPGEEPGPALEAILRGIFDGGRPLPAPPGIHAADWGAEGGPAATAAVSVDPAAGVLDVRCLTARFLGAARQRVRVHRTIPDPACPFCDFLQGEVIVGGTGPRPVILVEIEDPAFARDADLRGVEVVLQSTLLAPRVHAYDDRADFLARRPDAFGPGEIVSAADPGPAVAGGAVRRPRLRAAGEVLSAEVLRNPLTGLPFVHALLDAPGGPWDVCAPADALPEPPRPGQWLLAEGSVVARFPDGLPRSTG